MNLRETVKAITGKDVTVEEARIFADEQFGTLMAYQKEQRPSTKELVNHITDFVNSFSPKTKEFNELMSREHRTLQQSFTRLCFSWIENCASPEYRTDGRNEASHTVCKKLVEGFNKSIDIDIPLSSFLSYV